jgi:predicted enzyme related to lactoylglutathione lyase
MLKLADFAVTVTDAQATARWWQDKLGFGTFTLGAPGSHAIMVAPPGERFLLHLCEGFEAVEPGNTGIAFMTDEIETLVRRMESSGVKFPQPLKMESWGASAKFADPDGNIFWLMGAPTEFIRKAADNRAKASPKISARPKGRKKSGRSR